MKPLGDHGNGAVELTLTELVTRAREVPARGGRSMLGITGAPGAGKSTLAAALATAFADSVAIVGMDGFHLAQRELQRLGREQRKGAPDTFDSFGYAALLRRLRENNDPVVYAPLFRRDLEEPVGGCVAVEKAIDLVITEGNYLLLEAAGWQEARRQLDAVWFLDLPDVTRLDRLIGRHERFGRDPLGARDWATGTDEANALVVLAGRDHADLVVRLVDD